MKNKNNDKDKNDEEDSLTLAKLVSTWYVGAVVGFAVGTLNGNSTTAIMGLFIGLLWYNIVVTARPNEI